MTCLLRPLRKQQKQQGYELAKASILLLETRDLKQHKILLLTAYVNGTMEVDNFPVCFHITSFTVNQNMTTPKTAVHPSVK